MDNKFEHAAIASWMTFGAASTIWTMIQNLETKILQHIGLSRNKQIKFHINLVLY